MKNEQPKKTREQREIARSARYLANNPARRRWLQARLRECAVEYLRRVEALRGAAAAEEGTNSDSLER